MCKVEQRRIQALSQDGDNSSNVLEGSLQQLIARYHFLDFWPCSSTDLDHLARQQIIAKSPSGKLEKSTPNPASSTRAGDSTALTYFQLGESGPAAMHVPAIIVPPDISHMVVYDPRQGFVGGMMGDVAMPGLQICPPGPPGGLLPRLGGPPPLPPGGLLMVPSEQRSETRAYSRCRCCNYSIVACGDTIALSSTATPAKPAHPQCRQRVISAADSSTSGRPQPGSNGSTRGGNQQQVNSGDERRGGGSGRSRQHQQQKCKQPDRTKEEEDTLLVQSRPPPRDVFRLQQLQRAHVVGNPGNPAVSGVASGGSGAYSGEWSGSSE